jgi:hypothetical protein
MKVNLIYIMPVRVSANRWKSVYATFNSGVCRCFHMARESGHMGEIDI